MAVTNHAHTNPPPVTTPEEAERNKRTMGKNQAAQDNDGEKGIPGSGGSVKNPDEGKATG